MAERKAKSGKPRFQGYIMNPTGTIHAVTKEHARQRLVLVGWSLPSDDEIAAYRSSRVQRFDRPIGTPFRASLEAALDDQVDGLAE